MRKFLALLFSLGLLLGVAFPVRSQQNLASAALYPQDISSFPRISGFLDVFDSNRIFATGLKPEAVSIVEDGRTLPVDTLNKIAVPLQLVIAVNQGASLDGQEDHGGFSARNRHYFVNANELIHELFQNIFSNAVKFDSSKRVRIEVSIAEESLATGASWVISVTDRGRGIPDDRKKAIFERFATGVTGIKGFGLGLSIVKSIVDKYGGRIWVEDRVKGDFTKGAVFKVVLPKARHPPSVATTSASSSRTRGPP